MVSTDLPTPRSDAELWTAHIAGEAGAFAELFARHGPRLARLAARRSDTPEDAADALQDAMLSAHRNAGRIRQHAAVGGWLYRIVNNTCIDRIRAKAARREQWFDEDAHPVEDRTAQIETALVVRTALLQLPPAQRVAVLAVDMHGYSVGEAAHLLGVPEGTVKSRRARARAQLVQALDPRRQRDDGSAGH